MLEATIHGLREATTCSLLSNDQMVAYTYILEHRFIKENETCDI